MSDLFKLYGTYFQGECCELLRGGRAISHSDRSIKYEGRDIGDDKYHYGESTIDLKLVDGRVVSLGDEWVERSEGERYPRTMWIYGILKKGDPYKVFSGYNGTYVFVCE